MKKFVLSMTTVLALGFSARAQLNVGDIAPDFTVTDINGQKHNLYAYLNQGYSVLVDVSATWCSPCWQFSSSGFMKRLYEDYGPDGTVTPGKMMVIFLEGDPATTVYDLYGMTSESQGDWVTGKPYPVINDHTLNNKFLYGGYPSFTFICPDKKVSFTSASGLYSSMLQTGFWEDYMNDCPQSATGISNLSTISDLTLFPNPTKGNITVRMSMEQAASVTFSIVNVIGQSAGKKETILLPAGQSEKQFDLSSLSPGIYFLQITTDDGKKTIRQFVAK